MLHRVSNLARYLTEVSVRRPLLTVLLGLGLTMALLFQAARLTSEVGYAAYFGPDDPAVQRLSDFFEEFDSGLHVLVVFGCPGSKMCTSVREQGALEFIGRLQRDLDRLPNVRKTQSVLNAPIVIGPLETQTIAERDDNGSYALASNWSALVDRSLSEPFLANIVVSKDGRTAGVIVELQSLQSQPVRDVVHAILDLVPRYEEELGSEIYVAGDPVWTVVADDDLDSDSLKLTVLMFILIAAILWVFFRDVWLTILPVLAVGGLTVAIHGVLALLSFPMTSILAALPPLLVVIAITSAIHLITTFLRHGDLAPAAALVRAAEEVGPGCLWASFTTAAGFASFLVSDLASFRQFGIAAGMGLALAFLGTFTLLPALLCLKPPRIRAADSVRFGVVRDLLGAALAAREEPSHLRVGHGRRGALGPRVWNPAPLLRGRLRRPVAGASLGPLHGGELPAADDHRARRNGAGGQADLRRGNPPAPTAPGTLLRSGAQHGVRVELPRFPRGGVPDRPWQQSRVLRRARNALPARRCRSSPPMKASPPSGASRPRTRRMEARIYRDRARISVHRSWLNGQEQIPYVDRLRDFIAKVNRDEEAQGYRVELTGGLELAALAEQRIRDTQWGSFGAAFGVVAVTLWALLWSNPWLATLATLCNLLPVMALLGVMGWLGIAVDPANTMVAAVLIAINDDDTIHMSLRYQRERRAGKSRLEAITDRASKPLARPS